MLSPAVTPARGPVSLFAQLEAERPRLLAQVAARLDGWHIPGRDVTAWLSGVPVLLIAECLRGPRAAVARRLFLLVGRARAAGARDPYLDISQADQTNVSQGTCAEAALQAWASLLLARASLDAGRPADATQDLRELLREIMRMPPHLGARFLPAAEQLIARAETASRAQDAGLAAVARALDLA